MDELTSQIDQRLTRTDDDLFAEIGNAVYGQSAFQRTPERLITAGKQWFAKNSTHLAEMVCRNSRIRSLARQDFHTHETIVAICGTLDVTIHYMNGVPAITVAILLTRLGLHHVCREIWNSINVDEIGAHDDGSGPPN